MEKRTCPACDAIAPGRFGRCPACGSGRSSSYFWLVGLLAALIVVSALVLAMRSSRTASPALVVQLTQTGFLRSLDDRGTDVSATIDNPNPVPVDVTVRVRGYDITDRVVIEEKLGPFRRVPPGKPYPIRTRLSATPLDSVAFDVIEVKPAGR